MKIKIDILKNYNLDPNTLPMLFRLSSDIDNASIIIRKLSNLHLDFEVDPIDKRNLIWNTLNSQNEEVSKSCFLILENTLQKFLVEEEENSEESLNDINLDDNSNKNIKSIKTEN